MKSITSSLLLSLFLVPSATSASEGGDERRLDSADEVTNGSLDMRLTVEMKIPKFYVVLSPTDHEFDDDENVQLLESTEDMLDWNFQTATGYQGGTSYESVELLGIKSWFVSGEDGSRERTRSLGEISARESNDVDDVEEDQGEMGEGGGSASSASLAPARPAIISHTIVEIEGGKAEFLVPANGKVPTKALVASIIKSAIEKDMINELNSPKMIGRNQIGGASTADFSSISTIKYIESANVKGIKGVENSLQDEGAITNEPKVDLLVSPQEQGKTTPTEYAFTTIFVGIAVGGAMLIFAAVALVSKLRKKKPLTTLAVYNDDLDGKSEGQSDKSRSVSLDFSHVSVDSQKTPPSPLNDFLQRTSPQFKKKKNKTKPTTPDMERTPSTVSSSVCDDVSSDFSMECQLSTSVVNKTVASDQHIGGSVVQNLNETHFGRAESDTSRSLPSPNATSSKKYRQRKLKTNLPPLDENSPYSIESYMSKDPTLSTSLQKTATFENDEAWEFTDNDVGSVSSGDGNGFDEI